MAEGGDNIQLEALVSSQFAVPPLRWIADQAPAFPTPRRRKLSTFQKLPLEVRHEIYKYLGFPVGRRLWVDCSYACCDKPAHARSPDGHTVRSSTDTAGSNDDEPDPKAYEHRMILKTICFESPDGLRDSIELDDNNNVDLGRHWNHFGRTVSSPCQAPWGDPNYHTLYPAWALLGVCKCIRAEALDLLFKHANIQFDYELTDKPVHECHWNKRKENEHYTYIGQYLHMHLNPGWFSQMRHVNLTEWAARGYSTRRKGISWVKSLLNTNRILERQAKSILFVAKYCPALVSLQADLDLPGSPHIHWSDPPRRKPKQSTLDFITLAFQSVVKSCTNLEKLIVPRAVREWHIRPDGRRYFGRQWQQLPAGNDEVVDHYRNHGSESLEVLELKDVATVMREQTARQWLKTLLKDLLAGPIYDLKVHDFSEPE